MPLQGVDGSGPYGPNPDLDRPQMDDSGIGPDPSCPDNGKSSHAMTSGRNVDIGTLLCTYNTILLS
jgi:hypothetical protein